MLAGKPSSGSAGPVFPRPLIPRGGSGASGLPLSARPATRHVNPNNGSIVLLLSLFLLLLVFFIVLNAQSVQTVQKVKAVAASLEKSFSDFVVDPRLREGTDTVASRAGTVFAVQRLDSVGTLFATAVAVAKVETVAPGHLLEVRLPADDLFVAGTMALRPDRQGLIDRVVDALRESRQGERMELDALLGIGTTGTPSQPPGPVARGGALARALIADGAPPQNVTIGIERGDPGGVRLLFTLRLADEPPAGKGPVPTQTRTGQAATSPAPAGPASAGRPPHHPQGGERR